MTRPRPQHFLANVTRKCCRASSASRLQGQTAIRLGPVANAIPDVSPTWKLPSFRGSGTGAVAWRSAYLKRCPVFAFVEGTRNNPVPHSDSWPESSPWHWIPQRIANPSRSPAGIKVGQCCGCSRGAKGRQNAFPSARPKLLKGNEYFIEFLESHSKWHTILAILASLNCCGARVIMRAQSGSD
jgi:hypothetical protein